MPRNPLAEVFGFPPDNFSATATRHRANKFCPFRQLFRFNAARSTAPQTRSAFAASWEVMGQRSLVPSAIPAGLDYCR